MPPGYKVIILIFLLLLIFVYLFQDQIIILTTDTTENVVIKEEFEPEPIKMEVKIDSLELLIFNLINEEREKNDLESLQWNSEVAASARKHSQYLANLNEGFVDNVYIDHLDANQEYHDSRLNADGVYYFNMSAENIYGNSIVKRYYNEPKFKIIEYYTEEELAELGVEGWMNSTGHRKNVLTSEYDETGVGIAKDPTNTSYVFTQVFIRRADCGFETGPCCEKTGYFPYCYVPLSCLNNICKK